MTAEVAVMNKLAIAMAADSALTIGMGQEKKVYFTCNKLFALSKYSPVGVMVYGNANFMDTPWETIIKLYRDNLGKDRFDTIAEYFADFLEFLKWSGGAIPKELQIEYYENILGSMYELIRESIDTDAQKKLNEDGSITDLDTKVIVNQKIKEWYDEWNSKKLLPSFTQNFESRLIKNNSLLINGLIRKVFAKLPISATNRNRLKKIAGMIITRAGRYQLENTAGIVIAGYGEKQVYPALVSARMECVIENMVKHVIEREIGIDNAMSASVMAFAQSEMVHTFMRGIAPDLEGFANAFLKNVFHQYPEIILECIPEGEKKAFGKIEKNFKKASIQIFDLYKEKMSEYIVSNQVNPIVGTVAHLPKEELATMAEALVNLTLLKRKITMAAETVGGPIDVALISKGDGLIWIKRKHYFKPELNCRFFDTYYINDSGVR